MAQALSKSGGLLDSRSDMRGVFIFRYELGSVARRLDPNNSLVEGRPLTPVVYRLNLSDPNSLFMEQSFRIANRDVIYVSNSPSTELQKVFGIVSGAFAPIGAGAGIVSAGASVAR